MDVQAASVQFTLPGDHTLAILDTRRSMDIKMTAATP
jgi:hypothetical protein